MICPRCGNEWDASKSPCTRCGLVIRLPNQTGSLNRPGSSAQRGISQPSGNLPPLTPPPSQGSAFSGPLPQSTPAPGSRATPRRFGSGSGSGSFPPSNPGSGFETNGRRGKQPSGAHDFGPALSQPKFSSADAPPSRNYGQRSSQGFPSGRQPDASSSVRDTQRSQVPVRPNRYPDFTSADAYRSQAPLRASRLITNPHARESQYAQMQQIASSFPQPTPGVVQNGSSPASSAQRPLVPGALLRGGRYRLQELQERQEWLAGVFEGGWMAQDAQRAGAQVMVCELMVPDNASIVMQSMLRTATVALTAIGRHPHVPMLWDAFSDQGRNFFVFEHIDGENLHTRMRRTGRAVDEQDVIECCLQITEVLESLAQQSPPLVHGLIRPEHIILVRSGSQYMLTNFSIVLAGGATQFVAGLDRTRLSPYAAPELTRGMVDTRSDLYSLLATAYHLVTGSAPAGVSGSIPQARRLNTGVSMEFDAILSKGLRPIASQRYQRPSELRQDLLSMRSVSGSLASGNGRWYDQAGPRSVPLPPKPSSNLPDSVANALPLMMASTVEEEDSRLLLPRPEELPPMQERNDTLQAAIWITCILIAIIIVVVMGRGVI